MEKKVVFLIPKTYDQHTYFSANKKTLPSTLSPSTRNDPKFSLVAKYIMVKKMITVPVKATTSLTPLPKGKVKGGSVPLAKAAGKVPKQKEAKLLVKDSPLSKALPKQGKK